MPVESDSESYFSDASKSFDEADGCGILSGSGIFLVFESFFVNFCTIFK